MPINSRKLGPGTLTLGAAALAVQSKLTKAKLNAAESVDAGERIKVLSGESKDSASTASYAFTLEGTFLQDDPGAASVVDWSWANMGTEQAFVFVPNTVGNRKVTGVLVPTPLSIGGDEVDGADMSSDFTWRVIGTPTRGTVTI